jgi:hypothetical protein
MSGPIIRSGPNPQFSKNWAQVFGDKKETEKPAKKKAAKAKAKSAKKKKS